MLRQAFITQLLCWDRIIDYYRYSLSQAHINQRYCGHGTISLAEDLQALIANSLSVSFDILPSLWLAQLSAAEKITLSERLALRVIDAVPVPYITNTAYFCDLEFFVDARVLIPRSPIAELIQASFAPWIRSDQVHRILDLCTGSGCIAIACAYAFPDAIIDAVDISSAALDVATLNQQKHADMTDLVTFIESDCWEKVPLVKYDIIVSNPPYVGFEEMQTLPAEYSHEPCLALQAENNGLMIIEKILAQAKEYLTPHGILVMEVGNTAALLRAKHPDIPFIWVDLANGGDGVFVLML